MSGTKDTNWKSYVGPADNGRAITPEDWSAPVNPLDFDDLFKVSNVEDLTVCELEIPTGREDSIDVVRGGLVFFRKCKIHGSITLKGALRYWSITDCTVSGTIELGQFDNYWTPGRVPTRNGLLMRVKSPDGAPVRIKVWDAEVPQIIDSNVKITKVPKVIWYPYFLFRYLQTKFKNA